MKAGRMTTVFLLLLCAAAGQAAAAEPAQEANHVVAMTPAQGAGQVSFDTHDAVSRSSLEIVFDQAVCVGSGAFYLCDYQTGQVYRTFYGAANSQGSGSSGTFTVDREDRTRVMLRFFNQYTRCRNEGVEVIPYDTQLCVKMDADAVRFLAQPEETSVISDRDTWTFHTKWGLTPGVDLLPFANTEKYFGCTHYDLSEQLRQTLNGMLDLSQSKKLYQLSEQEAWNGSCAGMCAVTALAYTGDLDLSRWNVSGDASPAQNCAEIAAPKDSTGVCGTRDLINYYQLLVNLYIDSQGKESAFLSQFNDWNGIWQRLSAEGRQLQTKKRPIFLRTSFRTRDTETGRSTERSHAFLITGYREEQGNRIFELYDPSYPWTYTEIVLDGENNAVLHGGWQGEDGECVVTGVAETDLSQLAAYNRDLLAARLTGTQETVLDSGNAEDAS